MSKRLSGTNEPSLFPMGAASGALLYGTLRWTQRQAQHRWCMPLPKRTRRSLIADGGSEWRTGSLSTLWRALTGCRSGHLVWRSWNAVDHVLCPQSAASTCSQFIDKLRFSDIDRLGHMSVQRRHVCRTADQEAITASRVQAGFCGYESAKSCRSVSRITYG